MQYILSKILINNYLNHYFNNAIHLFFHQIEMVSKVVKYIHIVDALSVDANLPKEAYSRNTINFPSHNSQN